MTEVTFHQWIIAPLGSHLKPNDNGWVRINEWEVQSAEAEWEPCGLLLPNAWDDGMEAICMATPIHEHPHIACVRLHPGWSNDRIVRVRRRAQVMSS